VSAVARAEETRGGEVSLVFVDDAFIRELTGKYLGDRRATDVLAFPLLDGPEAGTAGSDDLLGEIYISTDRAVEQARRRHLALSVEVARLIVHGLLHLFGYRDDTPSARREMLRRQEKLLREHRRLASDVARPAGRTGRRG